MATIQKHKPKGTPGAGQFDGIHRQYADVRLRMEAAAFSGPVNAMEAALNHATFMDSATRGYALSEALPFRDREAFTDRNEVCQEYRAALRRIHDSGQAAPDDFAVLAETFESKAVSADAARVWTPRARRRNETVAVDYRYLARTLRTLASWRGESS